MAITIAEKERDDRKKPGKEKQYPSPTNSTNRHSPVRTSSRNIDKKSQSQASLDKSRAKTNPVNEMHPSAWSPKGCSHVSQQHMPVLYSETSSQLESSTKTSSGKQTSQKESRTESQPSGPCSDAVTPTAKESGKTRNGRKRNTPQKVDTPSSANKHTANGSTVESTEGPEKTGIGMFYYTQAGHCFLVHPLDPEEVEKERENNVEVIPVSGRKDEEGRQLYLKRMKSKDIRKDISKASHYEVTPGSSPEEKGTQSVKVRDLEQPIWSSVQSGAQSGMSSKTQSRTEDSMQSRSQSKPQSRAQSRTQSRSKNWSTSRVHSRVSRSRTQMGTHLPMDSKMHSRSRSSGARSYHRSLKLFENLKKRLVDSSSSEQEDGYEIQPRTESVLRHAQRRRQEHMQRRLYAVPGDMAENEEGFDLDVEGDDAEDDLEPRFHPIQTVYKAQEFGTEKNPHKRNFPMQAYSTKTGRIFYVGCSDDEGQGGHRLQPPYFTTSGLPYARAMEDASIYADPAKPYYAVGHSNKRRIVKEETNSNVPDRNLVKVAWLTRTFIDATGKRQKHQTLNEFRVRATSKAQSEDREEPAPEDTKEAFQEVDKVLEGEKVKKTDRSLIGVLQAIKDKLSKSTIPNTDVKLESLSDKELFDMSLRFGNPYAAVPQGAFSQVDRDNMFPSPVQGRQSTTSKEDMDSLVRYPYVVQGGDVTRSISTDAIKLPSTEIDETDLFIDSFPYKVNEMARPSKFSPKSSRAALYIPSDDNIYHLSESPSGKNIFKALHPNMSKIDRTSGRDKHKNHIEKAPSRNNETKTIGKFQPEQGGSHSIISRVKVTDGSFTSLASMKSRSDSRIFSPKKNNEDRLITSPVLDIFRSLASSPVKDILRSLASSPVKDILRSLASSPVKDRERSLASSPVKDRERSLASSPVKDRERSLASSPVKDRERSLVASPVKYRKSLVASQLKGRERSLAESPVKDRDRSFKTSLVKDIENYSVASPVKDRDRSLAASPVKDRSRSLVTSPIKDTDRSLMTSLVKDIDRCLVTSPVKDVERSLASSPVKDRERSLVASPVKDRERSLASSPVKDRERSLVASPVKDRERSLASSPVMDRLRSLASSPVKDRERSLVASPVKDRERSLASSPVMDRLRSLSSSPVKDRERSLVASPMKDRERSLVKSPVKERKGSGMIYQVRSRNGSSVTSPVKSKDGSLVSPEKSRDSIVHSTLRKDKSSKRRAKASSITSGTRKGKVIHKATVSPEKDDARSTVSSVKTKDSNISLALPSSKTSIRSMVSYPMKRNGSKSVTCDTNKENDRVVAHTRKKYDASKSPPDMAKAGRQLVKSSSKKDINNLERKVPQTTAAKSTSRDKDSRNIPKDTKQIENKRQLVRSPSAELFKSRIPIKSKRRHSLGEETHSNKEAIGERMGHAHPLPSPLDATRKPHLTSQSPEADSPTALKAFVFGDSKKKLPSLPKPPAQALFEARPLEKAWCESSEGQQGAEGPLSVVDVTRLEKYSKNSGDRKVKHPPTAGKLRPIETSEQDVDTKSVAEMKAQASLRNSITIRRATYHESRKLEKATLNEPTVPKSVESKPYEVSYWLDSKKERREQYSTDRTPSTSVEDEGEHKLPADTLTHSSKHKPDTKEVMAVLKRGLYGMPEKHLQPETHLSGILGNSRNKNVRTHQESTSYLPNLEHFRALTQAASPQEPSVEKSNEAKEQLSDISHQWRGRSQNKKRLSLLLAEPPSPIPEADDDLRKLTVPLMRNRTTVRSYRPSSPHSHDTSARKQPALGRIPPQAHHYPSPYDYSTTYNEDRARSYVSPYVKSRRQSF